ncbi:alpha-N-acetylgalactosaminide alpha-2,6-sialyltransferase 6-like isoform X1 [Asterias rubens]|uniref:alpha-N-acetylgalactosaminide alpha-2,6-sialyltransferase 6-like isoform X1 n=1 Tax=Asterias rubens TaxID=7604 RepID=UPI0014558464|nr:alpha-N-acetylgalactosaminide alpha-2,6-sialyltransferase 6-like isoform X1 [Asterias rubens]XP_033626594.1 alpha-N-acetylgalactosaminide alpha-2,6-sialyltransferase 6-like isoform X1 [Asterias rubens]
MRPLPMLNLRQAFTLTVFVSFLMPLYFVIYRYHNERVDYQHQAPIFTGAVNGSIRHYKSLLGDDQPVTLRCSSCALVSSSGYLLDKGAGQAIEGHPCVIRMNSAPVKGYEKDVGNRTTVRVMNFMDGVRADRLPPEGSDVLVWGLFRRESYLSKVKETVKRLRPGIFIHAQTYEGEKEAEDLFNSETGTSLRTTKSWLSTGWFAMMVAIDICTEVHVYGMVSSNYCASKPEKDCPYYYYRTPHIKECSTYNGAERNKGGGHRFITEKAIFARWGSRYNIEFHYPSWTINKDKSGHQLDSPFVRILA